MGLSNIVYGPRIKFFESQKYPERKTQVLENLRCLLDKFSILGNNPENGVFSLKITIPNEIPKPEWYGRKPTI